MSRRFLRWADGWIGEHVWPGAGADIEPFAMRAERLARDLAAQALREGFKPYEVDEDADKLRPMILKAVTIDTVHGGNDLGNG